ncbi:MAG: hypothetical protein JWN31_498 [Frankiales bacterium]|nr:hypothetical protein [Frankiales bacterium]
MTSTAAWTSRIDQQAMSPAELAGFMDREADRFDGLLFTATPAEELDGLGRAQRLYDQAFVLRAREIVAIWQRAARDAREFVVDEVALALGFSPTGAGKVVAAALDLAELGLLEAIDAGPMTANHALAVLRELDKVVLSCEQRTAIAFILMRRAAGRTPGELMKLTRGLILQVDPEAASNREAEATRKRQVLFYGAEDGQGVMQLRGPVADTASIEAVLRQLKSDHPKPEGITVDQWEYQLILQLLTGDIRPGAWQAQVIVPFTTATGSNTDSGELELAEIPGYGPILPSTARKLLEDADWTQVAVDENGVVIAVSDPVPAPRRATSPSRVTSVTPAPADTSPTTSPAGSAAKARMRENWELSLAQLISIPPKQRLMPEQLGSSSYATSSRLKRYLQARDRTCVFPGCHRRITDVDHRIPWPLGPTAAANLQLLCRHHHRAKQAVFTVELTMNGDYLWTSRGGWQFTRHRQAY